MTLAVAFSTLGLFALGVVGGVVSTIAGGASLLTMPALVLFGLSPMAAQATNFVALAPSSFSAVWTDRRLLPAMTRGLALVCATGFLGALLGGAALLATGEAAFRAMVPLLLGLATALYALAPAIGRLVAARGEGEAYGPGVLTAFSAAGVYSGYFGTGYGVILLALLRVAGVEDALRANILKNLIGAWQGAASLAFFATTALVHWPTALAMGAGNILGGVLGAHAARVAPAALLRRVILVAGVAITLAIARRYWF